LEARFPPDSTRLAFKIFGFLRENENLTTNVGMEGSFTGLDRQKLAESAKNMYGINLSKYAFMVTEYETEMLKKQQREYEARK